MAPPGIPAGLLALFEAVHEAGGRALLVGGCVRDAILGLPGKDIDIEVHRLPLDALMRVLRRFGRVNEVGRSFGVLKLRVGEDEIDVSVPRRDSRVGEGHKGIRADADPFLGETEAARRRDLTVNAIAYDPRTGAYVDPFDGRADLAAGRLRAVDAGTFGEDPLRALRVVQFAARFGFTPDAALRDICAAMPLHELPPERVRGEVEKFLLKGRDHARGWAFGLDAGLWQKVLPGWARPCPARLLRVARPAEEGRALALALAAACTPEDVVDTLDRLRIHRREGYDLRAHVLFLVTHSGVQGDDTALRTWADEGDLRLLAELDGSPALLARAVALGVADAPLPPLLLGRDLLAMGLPAGRRMGAILAEVRVEQLAGRLQSTEEARRWAAEKVNSG